MTQWAFGFGGWIGVFGGFFLFLNVPHNYSALLLLLSPWLGAISLYLLMFMTFSWMNVCAQVTNAMIKQEIVVAVLTSFVGVLIVAIARFLIEMERGYRTPAQAAAEESAATTTATPLPPSPPSEHETETETTDSADAKSDSDFDSETEIEHEEHENSSKEDTVKSPTVESNDGGREDEATEDTEDEGEDEASEDTGDEEDEGEEDEASEDTESSLNKARTDSSYENIKTPQLSGIKYEVTISPIPTADADV